MVYIPSTTHANWSFPDALSKSSLPFVLVACKCDQHSTHREVDPAVVEQKARSFLGNVNTFQISESLPDTHRSCLSVITRAIIAAKRREYSSVYLATLYTHVQVTTMLLCTLHARTTPLFTALVIDC